MLQRAQTAHRLALAGLFASVVSRNLCGSSVPPVAVSRSFPARSLPRSLSLRGGGDMADQSSCARSSSQDQASSASSGQDQGDKDHEGSAHPLSLAHPGGRTLSSHLTCSRSHAFPFAVLALPPATGRLGDPTQVTVNGGSVSLEDEMGPLVVNENGTLSRIANWAEMTPIERERTVRILGKRNKLRLDKLKADGESAGAAAP